MSFSIKQLKAFLNVAHSGSFIAGALRSNMSQPTLSRTIRMLEDEVGARLFDRDTRGTMLTAAGLELVDVAKRLIDRHQAEREHFHRFLNGECGRLSLAALPSLAASLLADALKHTQSSTPDMKFAVEEASAEEVEIQVLKGNVDMGLSVRPADEAMFDWVPLLTDHFGLVMREDDPLASAPACDWHVLSDRAFASHVSGAGHCRYQTSALRAAGVEEGPAFRCREIASLAVYVERGLALGLLPHLCMPLLQRRGLVWRPLRQPFAPRQLGVLFRRSAMAASADSDLDSLALSRRPGVPATALLGKPARNMAEQVLLDALRKSAIAWLETTGVAAVFPAVVDASIPVDGGTDFVADATTAAGVTATRAHTEAAHGYAFCAQ